MYKRQFTLFIAFETWAMPFSGWLIDRLGPRFFLTFAGVLCGAGWAALGQVHSLKELYFFYSLAGFGAALVYCGSMGIALKWFPDKRGLAAGIISAGFGSGAALFIPIIAHILKVQEDVYKRQSHDRQTGGELRDKGSGRDAQA